MAGPKTFSLIEQDDIVERVAQGQKMAEIAALYRVKLNDFKRLAHLESPFYERIINAQKIAVETALEAIPGMIESEEQFQRAKLKADHAWRMAAKRYPEVYGDRIDVNINNKIDLSDVLQTANERVARIPQAFLSTEIVIPAELTELEELLK